jgi:hypothetical protein
MNDRSRERVVVAHTAGTVTEAMVIRGLLESAGIDSSIPASTYPLSLDERRVGMYGTDICVLESQADEARRVIAEYLKGNAGADSALDE